MKLNYRKRLGNFITALQVGFFLAVREIRRGNKWATGLIIMVMILTFLNLVVVSGVLVGLIEGSITANKTLFTSDVMISRFNERQFVDRSQEIVNFLSTMPEVKAFTPRYVEGMQAQSDYRAIPKLGETPNVAVGLISGIDPEQEDAVSGLKSKIIEGEYLEKNDFDEVMVGAYLLEKYLPIDSADLKTLKGVGAGDKIMITVNGHSREVRIKGVLKSKVDSIDMRMFMDERELRSLIGRTDGNVDEIAVKLYDTKDGPSVVAQLKEAGFGEYAKIQTFEEALPKFITDIRDTFAILGNLIGGVGLAVASITIFIVIFVNAITRRRYIGILKGIGINSVAIEFSYILQALFYSVVGMAIGLVIVFAVLQPYLTAHPINFPFSDGILVATFSSTALRVIVLFVATLIAGYIPARIVVKQNTLDAILGR